MAAVLLLAVQLLVLDTRWIYSMRQVLLSVEEVVVVVAGVGGLLPVVSWRVVPRAGRRRGWL